MSSFGFFLFVIIVFIVAFMLLKKIAGCIIKSIVFFVISGILLFIYLLCF